MTDKFLTCVGESWGAGAAPEAPASTGLVEFDEGAEPPVDEDAWLDSEVACVVTDVLVILDGVVYPLLCSPPTPLVLPSEWSLRWTEVCNYQKGQAL